VARTSGLKPSWLRRVLSVLGGADSQILARARVDTAEMTGRGIAVLIPAVFGGLAALISFRYAYGLPLGAAAAAGAGWAAVVLHRHRGRICRTQGDPWQHTDWDYRPGRQQRHSDPDGPEGTAAENRPRPHRLPMVYAAREIPKGQIAMPGETTDTAKSPTGHARSADRSCHRSRRGLARGGIAGLRRGEWHSGCVL